MLSRYRTKDTETSEDLGVIQTATLTLLALIIGFTFSMAIDRHDNRETLEEGEANAISTEYLRADLLPSKASARTKDLLNQYLDQRILFYSRQSKEKIEEIHQKTDELQNAMWNEILPFARSQPGATTALIVSGMNDVLNSQGYVQAAWWNRIPYPAWALMAAIAVCANILVGFGARNFKRNVGLFMIFPFVVAVSFFLIADIDSPRGGVIRIEARNLTTLKQNLTPKMNLNNTSSTNH
ncbi:MULTISPECIES: hypothetical protein [unclassified Polynucleobacter]|uniref:bestrophin-like domain n=1 Tax=unclassified Polynucleobacter TaxID=2640945 RepID=UPI00191BADF5|nr:MULTISPECIES: hypothetical protein [unclassified Polynucleobacter]